MPNPSRIWIRRLTASLLLASIAMAPISVGAAVQQDVYAPEIPDHADTLCRVDPMPGPGSDPVTGLWNAVAGLATHYCGELYIFVWYYPPGVYQVVCFATGVCPVPPPGGSLADSEPLALSHGECVEQPAGQEQACWVAGHVMCRLIPIECPEYCPPGTPPHNYYCVVFHEAMDEVFGPHDVRHSKSSDEAGRRAMVPADSCIGEVEVQYDLTGNSWGCDGPCLGNIIVQVSLGSNWVGCETTCAGNIIVQVGVHNNYFECAAGPIVDRIRRDDDSRTLETPGAFATSAALGAWPSAIAY